MNLSQSSNDNPETSKKNNRGGGFKLLVSMALITLVFVGIVAVAVFFMMVRGAEQTLVPDVRDKELVEALMELQIKELYPRIQLRYSQSSTDRGRILEQDPGAGTIVKAGRRIVLVVSQGVMLDRVGNYIGRNIDDVRIELQTFTDSSIGQLIRLREPLTYDYSPETPGTILRQRPEPGAEISGPTDLALVVSRGQENVFLNVPSLTGLSFTSALDQIGRTGIAFEFSIREAVTGEPGGVVVSQNPTAGASISSDTVVDLVVTIPSRVNPGEVFRLFSYTMPRNPYPLPVRLDAVLPSEERIRLINVDFQGGRFTVPYRLPVGSTLILMMMDRELHQETVRG